MRLRASVAAAAAVLAIAAAAVHPAAQDADQKVANGGILVKGWQGRADAGKQGLTVNDSRFAAEGKGFRLTTGPAAFYWNPANTGKGDYTARATFREPKQTYTHPHPFGVFIGGRGLDSDAPSALYCVAYRNGNYLVRMFSGGKVVQVSGKPAPHDAVRKAGGPEEEVVQEVAWHVKGDRVECTVNGTAVWSGAKVDVTGPGKLESTDGIAGIRAGHNSDVLITGFEVR